MHDETYKVFPVQDLPQEEGWLQRQPTTVIAIWEGVATNADVCIADEAEG